MKTKMHQSLAFEGMTLERLKALSTGPAKFDFFSFVLGYIIINQIAKP